MVTDRATPPRNVALTNYDHVRHASSCKFHNAGSQRIPLEERGRPSTADEFTARVRTNKRAALSSFFNNPALVNTNTFGLPCFDTDLRPPVIGTPAERRLSRCGAFRKN